MIEVDVALAVHLRKLGLASDGNRRRDDLAGLRIEDGGIAAAAVEGEDAVGTGS